MEEHPDVSPLVGDAGIHPEATAVGDVLVEASAVVQPLVLTVDRHDYRYPDGEGARIEPSNLSLPLSRPMKPGYPSKIIPYEKGPTHAEDGVLIKRLHQYLWPDARCFAHGDCDDWFLLSGCHQIPPQGRTKHLVTAPRPDGP